jgi:hypothetical protein
MNEEMKLCIRLAPCFIGLIFLDRWMKDFQMLHRNAVSWIARA